jgi:curved DNA-binding protein CbpA
MIEASKFIDYYETLEISPNANSGTIERMFRYLAQRYHPDNPDSGDRLRFDAIMEAYDALRDPVKRAQFDIEYKNHSNFSWKLASEASNGKGIEHDVDIQSRLLSILYVRRRQSIKDPGIGNYTLERLLDCPVEHLEFHLWYMREKGWVGMTESGMFAITAEGVDRAAKTINKLLTDQSDRHNAPRGASARG